MQSVYNRCKMRVFLNIHQVSCSIFIKKPEYAPPSHRSTTGVRTPIKYLEEIYTESEILYK